MMDVTQESPVKFTCRGDVDMVKFNFFKMCFGLSHAFFPDVTWMEHIVDNINALPRKSLGSTAITAGFDSSTKYYAAIVVQLPQMASGGFQWNRF